MTPEIFTQRFPVDAADIDELGHVNNIVYLRWAQDIATAHWRTRAGEANVGAYVWVVTRHEVDYRSSLTLGDEVEARTHVDAAPRGPLWRRFVDVYRAGAAEPAVRVQSNWCLLDAATRRLRRVPPEMAAKFFL